MGRVRLTGGGYSKRPFSKSKRSQKAPPKREFINVAGSLTILANHAVLQEKEPTGASTGKTYTVNLASLISRLPKRYKNSENLEIICTLSARLDTDSERDDFDDLQQDYLYRVSCIHYVIDRQKVDDKKRYEDESASNPLLGSQGFNALNSYSSSSSIYAQEIEPSICDISIFEYVNNNNNKEETERKISDYIQKCIGGVRELITPDGDRIDLLTSDVLVEVKAATDWDNSLGQILKYKIHYPNHKPVIFLFDDGFSCEVAKSRLLQVIQKYVNVDIYVVSSVEKLQKAIH